MATNAQLQTVISVSQQIAIVSGQMYQLAQNFLSLQANGFVIGTVIGGVTLTSTLNQFDQNALLAKYNELKTTLLSLGSQLP